MYHDARSLECQICALFVLRFLRGSLVIFLFRHTKGTEGRLMGRSYMSEHPHVLSLKLLKFHAGIHKIRV
jgi:hypothetical protein